MDVDLIYWLRWNAKEQGSRFGEAADEIEKLRWVLDTIVTNTDPNSTKHRDYDDLIKKIYMCARAALEETE